MLADSPFTIRTAGDREAGARCPHCAATIALGEQIAGCVRCGAVHHLVCWQTHDGCGSFECAPARRILPTGRTPDLRISNDDVSYIRPLPRGVAMPQNGMIVAPFSAPAAPRRPSLLAILAFIAALGSIGLAALAALGPRAGFQGPLAGLADLGSMISGVVAVLLSSLALANIHQGARRGLALAVFGSCWD